MNKEPIPQHLKVYRRNLIITAVIGVIAMASVMFWFTNELQSRVDQAQEKAYMEGQIDAITGDVRIQKNTTGGWEWIKSPWNNNQVECTYDHNKDKFDY